MIDEIRRFQKDVYNFQEVGRLFIVFYCVNILCTYILTSLHFLLFTSLLINVHLCELPVKKLFS